jgi:hypothetical protein
MLRRLTTALPLVWFGFVMVPGKAQTCSNATWQGTYFALLQGVVNSSTPYIELDKIVADGNGGIQFSVTENTNGAISTSSYSGSYTVNASCDGTVTPSGDAQASSAFQLTDGGATVFIVALPPNVLLAGKAYRAATHCTTGSLYGAYGFVTNDGTSGAEGFANTGDFAFDGNGNYTYAGYENDFTSSTTIQGSNGTYSVNADCTGSMSAPPDHKVIAIAEDGRVLTVDNDGDFVSDLLLPVSNRAVLGQFAFGGGWYSAVYFTNANSYPVSFAVSFFADTGSPLNVPGTGTSATVSLGAQATTIIEAPNSGALTEGYVSMALPPGVKAYGVFRQSVPGVPDQEAVAPLASALSTTVSLTYDETSYITGVAIVNPSPVANTVTITVLDDTGAMVGSTTVNLPANGKAEAALRSYPPLAGIVGKRGTAIFTASAGNVAVLGLRFNGHAFTSIPATGN